MKIMQNWLLLLILLMSGACTTEEAAVTKDETIKEDNSDQGAQDFTPEAELYVDGFSIAWGMDWLPDGDMLVTEKAGELYRVRDGKIVGEITGLPEVKQQGQGGLMDVKVHPDYANKPWIYLTFASPAGGGSGANTSLMRAQLSGNSLTNVEILYQAEPNTTRGQHFGSRIEFDNEGYLYFSVGDRGQRDLNPQDIYKDNGKIYRLTEEGKVPADNPYVGQQSAVEAIFSYGHRNPQGMAKNPATGEIWTHEHGPKGGDEINIIRKGNNYGWPEISYGVNYNGTPFTDKTEAPGMEQPVWYWVPSIAPSGMAFVDSDRYPGWEGDLLIGSLKFGYVMYCDVEGDEVKSEKPLFEGIGRVRAVEQGPDGYIYFSVEGKGIYRIVD